MTEILTHPNTGELIMATGFSILMICGGIGFLIAVIKNKPIIGD